MGRTYGHVDGETHYNAIPSASKGVDAIQSGGSTRLHHARNGKQDAKVGSHIATVKGNCIKQNERQTVEFALRLLFAKYSDNRHIILFELMFIRYKKLKSSLTISSKKLNNVQQLSQSIPKV